MHSWPRAVAIVGAAFAIMGSIALIQWKEASSNEEVAKACVAAGSEWVPAGMRTIMKCVRPTK